MRIPDWDCQASLRMHLANVFAIRRFGVAAFWLQRMLVLLIVLGMAEEAWAQSQKAAIVVDTVPGNESEKCSDLVFLRRAWVTLNGRVPPEVEVDKVLNARLPLDRSALVERLLNSPEFANVWGRWMLRLFGCEEESLSAGAFATGVPRERLFWLWHRWMRQQIEQDRPYDQILNELIAATSRSPGESLSDYSIRYHALNDALKLRFTVPEDFNQWRNDLFWKSTRTPIQNAELISRNLLGYRLECARCHEHPFTNISVDDHRSFSAIFQRVVYSERPFTYQQKHDWFFNAAMSSLLMVLFCIVLTASAFKKGWSRLTEIFVSLWGFLSSVIAYLCLHFIHYVIPSNTGAYKPPSVWLHEHLAGLTVPLIMALAVIIGFGAFCLFKIRKRGKRPLSLAGNAIVMCVLMTLGFLTIDLCMIRWQGNSRAPSTIVARISQLLRERTHPAKESLIREIHDDTNGNYEVIGSPKILYGPELSDGPGSSPRQLFAQWLAEEPSHQIDRNIVNRIGLRLLGRPFVNPVDDVRQEGLSVARPVFHDLVEGFVQHRRSFKWLVRTIVLSNEFQSMAAEEVDMFFAARSLRGEEIIASLNQLCRTKITTSQKWSPVPDDPYQCGSEVPNREELGDRLIRFSHLSDEELDLPLEEVSILMVDSAFMTFLKDAAQELFPGESVHAEEIQFVARSLWGKSATEGEMQVFTDPHHDWRPEEILAALVNNPRFLVVE